MPFKSTEDFLAGAGLETREEAIARKRRELQAQQQLQIEQMRTDPNATHSQRMLRGASGKFGAAFRNKFGPGPEFDDVEERNFKIMADAKAKVSAVEQAFGRAGTSELMTAAKRNQLYKEALMESAAQNGDAKLAARLGFEIEKEKRSVENETQSLRKLRGEATGQQIENWKALKPKPGQPTTVWPQGSANYYEGRTLMMDEQGNMRDAKGKIVYPVGDYTTQAPKVFKPNKGGTAMTWDEMSAKDKATMAKSLLGGTASIQGIQNEIKGAQQLMATGIDVNNLLKNTLDPESGVPTTLGWPGQLAQVSGRMVDAAHGFLQLARDDVPADQRNTFYGTGRLAGTSLDGSPKSIAQFKKDNKDFFDELNDTYLPTLAEMTKEDRAVFETKLIEAAYASLATSEQGGRFSDKDFALHYSKMGAGSGSLREWQRTFNANVNSALRKVKISQSVYPREAYNLVINETALDDLDTYIKHYESQMGIKTGTEADAPFQPGYDPNAVEEPPPTQEPTVLDDDAIFEAFGGR